MAIRSMAHPSFAQFFSKTPLGDVFSDTSWVSLEDSSLDWLNLPPPAFRDYVRTVPRVSYDKIHQDPKTFKNNPTFLIAQAHRVWITLSKLQQHLPDAPGAVLLDLGAFPFALDTAVRRFLHRSCRILATVNQNLTAGENAALQGLGIEPLAVNLDPKVAVAARPPGMTDFIPLPSESVDTVLFAHVIEHLYHPLQILQEAARVLKPGGKLVLTTDNAFLLGGFLNYLTHGNFVHEPVEGTSAITFNEWRGHVRFFSEGDLTILLERAGLAVIGAEFHEAMYNSLFDDYFVEPQSGMPRWRANLLTKFPYLRNEIVMVAAKTAPSASAPVSNPFESTVYVPELARLATDFSRDRCDLEYAGPLDLAFGMRLLFGRWPVRRELQEFTAHPDRRGVDGLVERLLSSPEFVARKVGVPLDRPAHDCIVMAETPDNLRFFFSIRDTFVGLPVAIGVFEPGMLEVFKRLLKPGMNCIDVGANIGYYSIHFAQWIEPGGRVFSFEPDPFAYHLLLKNRTENGREQVIEAFPFACGEANYDSQVFRHPNPANYGGSQVRDPLRHSLEREGPGQAVPVRKLDDVIPIAISIGLVKMDVEGYEPFVLAGMKRIVKQCAPVIVSEFHTDLLRMAGEDAPARFLADLRALGYSIWRAVPFGQGDQIPFQYSGSNACYDNVVCLPPES
jgi:FkbM family methyltransferase